jgi:hypothetical protein
MSTKQLSLRVPPTLALAEGATTPAALDGAVAWSSTTGRLMAFNATAGRWRSYVPIHVGTTAPDNPSINDLWVDTN